MLESGFDGMLRHVPVYLFKEPGAKVPKIGLAELAAIRFYTMWDLMKDVLTLEPLKGRGSRGGMRGVVWSKRTPISDTIKKWHDTAYKKAQRESKDIVQRERIYETEINRLLSSELKRLYRPNSKKLESTMDNMIRKNSDYLGYRYRSYFRKYVARASTTTRPRFDNTRRELRVHNLREQPPYYRMERVEPSLRIVPDRGLPPREPLVREPPIREVPPREPTPRGPTPREPLLRQPSGRIPPERVPPPKGTAIKAVGIDIKGGTKRRRFPMDSFAWRQGFGYWILTPPYSGTIGKDMIFTRTKPAGVSIVKGPDSAYKSITKLGINVPKGALIDLGIMDIQIKKKGSKMEYTRDVKQKTKLGRPVGMPPGIVGARGR